MHWPQTECVHFHIFSNSLQIASYELRVPNCEEHYLVFFFCFFVQFIFFRSPPVYYCISFHMCILFFALRSTIAFYFLSNCCGRFLFRSLALYAQNTIFNFSLSQSFVSKILYNQISETEKKIKYKRLMFHVQCMWYHVMILYIFHGLCAH